MQAYGLGISEVEKCPGNPFFVGRDLCLDLLFDALKMKGKTYENVKAVDSDT
jgi:hypothetical protein